MIHPSRVLFPRLVGANVYIFHGDQTGEEKVLLPVSRVKLKRFEMAETTAGLDGDVELERFADFAGLVGAEIFASNAPGTDDP